MPRGRTLLRIVLPGMEWVDMRSVKVNRTVPIRGSSDRVVLFSWGVNPEPLQRNVARVDTHGNVVWRAELPGRAASDCFNRLARDGDGFVASTFSGWSVWLDPDGRVKHAVREAAAATP